MLLLVLLVRVVMLDGHQQSLLHLCSLIQIFVIELVLRIFASLQACAPDFWADGFCRYTIAGPRLHAQR